MGGCSCLPPLTCCCTRALLIGHALQPAVLCRGVNIPFDITAGKGPIIADPIRTMEVSTVVPTY